MDEGGSCFTGRRARTIKIILFTCFAFIWVTMVIAICIVYEKWQPILSLIVLFVASVPIFMCYESDAPLFDEDLSMYKDLCKSLGYILFVLLVTSAFIIQVLFAYHREINPDVLVLTGISSFFGTLAVFIIVYWRFTDK